MSTNMDRRIWICRIHSEWNYYGRVVEAKKVCNELNRIHLIEFQVNAIGFDLIEFDSI